MASLRWQFIRWDEMMDRLFVVLDGYCERTDAGFWSEPLNLLTNLAFLLAAVIMWRRGAGVAMARWLAVLLFVIGLGSGLMHGFAQVWSAVADTVPILGFILMYLFAVNRDVLGLAPWRAGLITAAFVPYALLTAPFWAQVPVYSVSAGYMPVPTLIVIYAVFLWPTYPIFARRLLAGAGLLLVSLLARSLDTAACAVLPVGTHFLWHLLNALMLAWMIEAYLRQRKDRERG